MVNNELPIPSHFKPEKTGELWRVDYQNIAKLASDWAKQNDIRPSSQDNLKVCLIAVDVQNTFCLPGFELFVGGRSGTGAVDDNLKLSQFIYRNLHSITEIVPTMDTHQEMQIFHSIFFVNDSGEHPAPYTQISVDDIKEGKWRFNKKLGHNLSYSTQYIEQHLLHYTEELKKAGKYELTIWPYHAMLGGIGHALVSSIEEAIFFHSISRFSQPDIHVKGDHPLTEHYSVLRAEVSTGPDGESLSQRSESLFQKSAGSEVIYRKLIDFDLVIIAGQAKSHCVARTIADLLDNAMERDKALVKKIYLLEDCTSPVVIPGVIDYTDQAELAFKEFSDAGMNIVRSTEPISNWPGLKVKIA
jgi:nicotinamidase-related amidase